MCPCILAREKGEKLLSEIKGNTQFVNVDIDDRSTLESAFNGKALDNFAEICMSMMMMRKVLLYNNELFYRDRPCSSCGWTIPT